MSIEKVKINTEFIKLDQFLKWAGMMNNGSDAKEMILKGMIKVNGQKELQRGKKLRKGDIVDFCDLSFEVD